MMREINSACRHTDAERAITGLWTSEESIRKGYKITNIYEVTHFKQSSTDLWKSYIRKFLKIKLETSLHAAKNTGGKPRSLT